MRRLGPRCGDGMTEPGVEQCDDGREPVDLWPAGCGRAARPSRCGDGKVDSLWGEQCDDGNSASKDGCSAICKLEILVTV